MKMRKLFAVLLVLILTLSLTPGMASASVLAASAPRTVTVDGREIQVEAYDIGGCSYFKLRDVAQLLSGTESEFSVEFHSGEKLITVATGADYVPVGGELEIGRDRSGSCTESTWTLTVDGLPLKVDAYSLGGNNYFKLRDLGTAIGFGVSGGESEEHISITSGGCSLVFDPDEFTTGSVGVYGEQVEYKVYPITYVTNPVSREMQTMMIYIPLNATQQSPIYMGMKTGAYLQVSAYEPAEVTAENVNEASWGTTGIGVAHAASLALAKGYVAVVPVARGRNTVQELGGIPSEIGNAPASIVDLKAIVRYLRYNDAIMPGNAERILINGTSGGGAYTAILGATGDSPAYEPYLEELGAADTSDVIFAAAPYCPITDLDNANMAYEWMFCGVEMASQQGGALNEQDQVFSKVYADMFECYISGLGLEDPATGKTLTLSGGVTDKKAGSYVDYYRSVVEESATKFFVESGYIAADGSLGAEGKAYLEGTIHIGEEARTVKPGDFLSWETETGTVSVNDLGGYIRYMNRLKHVAAFDNGFRNVTAENDEFSTTPDITSNDVTVAGGWNHFDLNLSEAMAKAGTAGKPGYESPFGYQVSDEAAYLAAIMNPMYYLADYSGISGIKVNPYAGELYRSGTVAENWRIRVGSTDRDTAQTVSLNLSLALKAQGKNVDYAIAWEQPHTGSYDNTDMFAWFESLSK